MRKVWAATLASVPLAMSNGAFAQEATPSDTPDSAPSKAVRMTDAELDRIIAAGEFSVHFVSNPGNANHIKEGANHIHIVQSSGTNGGGTIGFMLVETKKHIVFHQR